MRVLLLAALLSVSSATVRADVCTTLGRAPEFALLASNRLKVRAGRSYQQTMKGTDIFDDVCAGQASLQTTLIVYGDTSNLVATAASGTAIKFLPLKPPLYSFSRNIVDGDVATGGGLVQGVGSGIDPSDIGGAIDQSGTHPALADCAQASADARTASSTFAALPATQDFGDVRIRVGETFTVSAPTGSVIHFASLTLESAPTSSYPGGYFRSCLSFEGDPARLEVIKDDFYNQQLVLNIDRLTIGRCAVIDAGNNTVINVPGPGPKVRLGGDGEPVAILAPDRKVHVEGTGDDNGTYLIHLWARNVSMNGLTVFDPGVFGPFCPTP